MANVTTPQHCDFKNDVAFGHNELWRPKSAYEKATATSSLYNLDQIIIKEYPSAAAGNIQGLSITGQPPAAAATAPGVSN